MRLYKKADSENSIQFFNICCLQPIGFNLRESQKINYPTGGERPTELSPDML